MPKKVTAPNAGIALRVQFAHVWPGVGCSSNWTRFTVTNQNLKCKSLIHRGQELEQVQKPPRRSTSKLRHSDKEFGEAQDWIGFLLCPSAVVRLDEVGLPAGERLNYAYSEIPSKNMALSRFQGSTGGIPAA